MLAANGKAERMNITELIKRLEETREAFGEIDVETGGPDGAPVTDVQTSSCKSRVWSVIYAERSAGA